MGSMIVISLGVMAVILLVSSFFSQRLFHFCVIWTVCIAFGILCIELNLPWLPLIIAAIIGAVGWWCDR